MSDSPKVPGSPQVPGSPKVPGSPNPNPSTNNSSGLPDAPYTVPPIVDFTLDQTIDLPGATVVNQQGTAVDGTEVTTTTFNTDASGSNLTLKEDLSGAVHSYYNDESDPNSPTNLVLNEIKDYASKINCSDFKGKGTVDDYAQLFQAAAAIANDVTHMKLDVDVQGFNEFGAAADDLSKLFNSFIVKLQTVSIIDDLAFLQSIASALQKIWNLSEVFGKFKETILATATVHIPQSSHDAKLLVQSVMAEVNCAMAYIGHFVNPLPNDPIDANLSARDVAVISGAVNTINNWSVLCEQGVTIAMASNLDIQYISTASKQLATNASLLQNTTSTLRGKLSLYNILS